MLSLMKRRERHGILAHGMFEVTTGLHFLQRMKLDRKLCVHNGCVNTICWNEKGTLILSGSDDQHLAVTDPFSGKNITKFRSGHRSNIFSAKFMPCSFDREVISCSGSGEIFYTNIDREDTYGANRFDCHFGSTYKLLVVPNEAATFLSCGDDGTVRFFDLRMKTSCSKFSCEEDVVILLRNPVTSMAVDPMIPYQLAVSTSDGTVRLYDRRMMKAQDAHAMNESLIFKFSPPMATVSQGGSNGRQQRSHRVTSLNFRPGSHDLLVNYSSENIYLFNTYDIHQQMVYTTSQAAAQQNPEVQVMSPSRNEEASTSKGENQAESTIREANAPVASTPSSDSDSDSSSFKPIKRLRLRGDWSDTGPDARPEREESGQNIMQRMSDLLTRMLNSHANENEGGGQDRENANDDIREEPQQPSENQGQAEHNGVDHTRQEGTDEAAAMLHSVVLRSMQSRTTESTAEREVTRSSISSESMVSHDLSPQDVETAASADPMVDSGSFQSSSTDDSASLAVESNTQRLSPRNVQPPVKTWSSSNEEGEGSYSPTIHTENEYQDSSTENVQTPTSENQLSISEQTRCEEMMSSAHSQSVSAHESEIVGDDVTHNEQESLLQAASSSSSDTTQTTVIPATNDFKHYKKTSLRSTHNMNEDDGLLNKTLTEETTFAADDLEIMETSCEGNTSVSDRIDKSLQIASPASCSNEKCSHTSKTNSILQAGEATPEIHNISKAINIEQGRATSVCNKDSSDLTAKTSLADTPASSTSLLTSDSFSMASLWSSSPSATTMAVAEDRLNSFESDSSQQTLCNVSPLSSQPTLASSITDSVLTNDQGLTQDSQRGLGLGSQRLPKLTPGKHAINKIGKEGLSERGSGTSKEANSSPNQDYRVEFSSRPHKPCKACKRAQLSQGKGKGQGKLSNTSKSSNSASTPDQFASYNSGKMRVSDDAPPNLEEAGTSAASSRTPGSNSSERHRRQGHSLPPTGKFQLYGSDDDDDDNDEDDTQANHRHPSGFIGSRQENSNERLSKAAKKIQEAFRQRREAREMAKMKDVDQPRVFMKFSGHRNCRTVIKEANFYGDNFVMSGSDCGRIMFWERETGRLVMYLDADKHVVNCVQPNPFSPVMASSGIDYDVKIWCPLEQDCQFDEIKSAEIVACNERMLEVTRDTVTVPAAFMLRILASLSQIRNGRGSARQQQQQEQEGQQG